MNTENKTNTSVRLPKTSFGIKVNFANLQTSVLQAWQNNNTYNKVINKNKNNKTFILHDGPPYANGNIHLGHVLNKVLKDIIVKGNWMLGHNAPFILGWDCHGLPIEWKIEEKYKAKNIKKSEVDINVLRNECADFADFWINQQTKEFTALGVLANYTNSYTTKHKQAEATIIQSLFKLVKQGYLYQDKRPITWSTVEQTALAEAEVEYKDIVTQSVYAGFELTEFAKENWIGAKVIIWTTTPWTLPANQALAYGKNVEYGLYKVTQIIDEEGSELNTTFVVAKDLLESFLAVSNIKAVNLLDTSIGLPNAQAKHCLFNLGYNFTVPLLLADFVETSTGTGIVHIAPSHGQDDFYLCKQHNIKPKELVEDNGMYTPNTPIFAGMFINKVAPSIFENLKINNNFFAISSYNHSYPHSWRSKAPVITRLTTQWFISLSANNARERAMQALDSVEFYPKISKNRLKTMLQNRPDWTISRQRAWGVPIALFVNKQTKQPLIDDTLFSNIVNAFKQHGCDIWFNQNPADFITQLGYNANDYNIVYDILDVWLESGLTQQFVLQDTNFGLQYPADVYLEGSDQHRGWFQSSLIMSILLSNQAPFKKVITHGYLLDDRGFKMSKSAGNGITAEQAIKDYGVDILRLWVASSNYLEDVNIGKNILTQQGELYKKLRNTLKYLIGNLQYFNTTVDYNNLEYIDKWLLSVIYDLDQDFENTMQNTFAIQQFMHKLFNFVINDLSAFYFDIKKDILYCNSALSHSFNSTLTAMDILFTYLCKWLLPVIPFTMEEAYATRYNTPIGQALLHNYTKANATWHNATINSDFAIIKDVKKVVTGCLEVQRSNKVIGSSLEALPTLFTSASNIAVLNKVNFVDVCIVSDLNIQEYTNQNTQNAFSLPEVENTFVIFNKHTGTKCSRCWRYYNTMQDTQNVLCTRCSQAVKENHEA